MSTKDQSNKEAQGELLKEVRTSKGITLESVHEETKIPLDVLRAIEEGYTVRMLSSFYLKGFVKMYARHLGIDVKDVLEEKPRDGLHSIERPQVSTIQKGGIEDRWSQEFGHVFTRERQKQLVQIVGILFLLFCIVKIGGCMFRRSKESVSKGRTAAAVQKEKRRASKTVRKKTSLKQTVEKQEPKKAQPKAAVPVPKTQPKSKKEEVKTKPQEKTPSKKKEEEKFKLTIIAKKNGWLQVKVDGNLVFQSTMKDGMTETWEAKEQIEISGKSIHFLEYRLNGKKTERLNDPRKTSRRVVITKDGLSIKK